MRESAQALVQFYAVGSAKNKITGTKEIRRKLHPQNTTTGLVGVCVVAKKKTRKAAETGASLIRSARFRSAKRNVAQTLQVINTVGIGFGEGGGRVGFGVSIESFP